MMFSFTTQEVARAPTHINTRFPEVRGAASSSTTTWAAIRRRIESRTRVEGDRVQGQALAILDDILEGDTKTSCRALVSVCHVIARRNVDTAGLRILTSACADVTAVGIRPGRDEKNLD